MPKGENIAGDHVEDQPGGHGQKHEGKQYRHELHEFSLGRVSRGHRHGCRAEKHGDTHDDRQDIGGIFYGKIRNPEHPIGLPEINR